MFIKKILRIRKQLFQNLIGKNSDHTETTCFVVNNYFGSVGVKTAGESVFKCMSQLSLNSETII